MEHSLPYDRGPRERLCVTLAQQRAWLGDIPASSAWRFQQLCRSETPSLSPAFLAPESSSRLCGTVACPQQGLQEDDRVHTHPDHHCWSQRDFERVNSTRKDSNRKRSQGTDMIMPFTCRLTVARVWAWNLRASPGACIWAPVTQVNPCHG